MASAYDEYDVPYDNATVLLQFLAEIARGATADALELAERDAQCLMRFEDGSDAPTPAPIALLQLQCDTDNGNYDAKLRVAADARYISRSVFEHVEAHARTRHGAMPGVDTGSGGSASAAVDPDYTDFLRKCWHTAFELRTHAQLGADGCRTADGLPVPIVYPVPQEDDTAGDGSDDDDSTFSDCSPGRLKPGALDDVQSHESSADSDDYNYDDDDSDDVCSYGSDTEDTESGTDASESAEATESAGSTECDTPTASPAQRRGVEGDDDDDD